MSVGFKARAYVNTTNATLVFTATADGTYNIRYSNMAGVPNGVTAWVSPNAASTPANADNITPNSPVAARGILEDTGIPMSAGEKLFVQMLVAGVAVRVMGADRSPT